MSIYYEIRQEAHRAHIKHQENSMRSMASGDPLRLAILMEEVGEVAREFNEARHHATAVDGKALRKELIQVAAMAADWADSLSDSGDLTEREK